MIPYVLCWLAEEDLVDDALPVLPATTTLNEPISPTSLSPGLPAVAGASGATPKIVLESKGYAIPEQQILVSPQVGGRVVELNFEAGQQVTKGEVLAVLDSTEYRAEYQRSLADVEAARERMIENEEGSRPDELRQALCGTGRNDSPVRSGEADLRMPQGTLRTEDCHAGGPGRCGEPIHCPRPADGSPAGHAAIDD